MLWKTSGSSSRAKRGLCFYTIGKADPSSLRSIGMTRTKQQIPRCRAPRDDRGVSGRRYLTPRRSRRRVSCRIASHTSAAAAVLSHISATDSALIATESELVVSWRENVDNLSRRMFALTTEGIAALAQTREMRDRLWHGLDLRKIATGPT